MLYAPLRCVAPYDKVVELFPFSPPEYGSLASESDEHSICDEENKSSNGSNGDTMSKGVFTNGDTSDDDSSSSSCEQNSSESDVTRIPDNDKQQRQQVDYTYRLKRAMSFSSISKPRGLVNCGNTCFANSVLQCLVSTSPLACLFMKRSLIAGSCAASSQVSYLKYSTKNLPRAPQNCLCAVAYVLPCVRIMRLS